MFQDLLKKCHQCVETIVKAKDQQAAEANKNATILLKELDLEKVSRKLLLYSCFSLSFNLLLFKPSYLMPASK